MLSAECRVMSPVMNRRKCLSSLSLAAAAALTPRRAAGQLQGRIFKAVKVTMIQAGQSTLDKFKITQDAGFDGISLFAPDRFNVQEALAAQDKTGVKIHNVNGTYHWEQRLSDADPAVRAKAVQNLADAIQFAGDCGADSVLLEIGKVTDPLRENQAQVEERSMAGMRQVLPLAARLGVRILCENVGNGFLPDATEWAGYLDRIHSPIVGAFFDIGNHHGFGGAPHWIRTLGARIVKIDVKDRNMTRNANCDLFDGDIAWDEVRAALREIGFTGWATAEVSGGDAERMRQVAQRMDRALGLAAAE